MSRESTGPIRPANEFSREITIDDLGSKGLAMKIEANPDERKALARRFGLVAVHVLTAEISAKPADGGGFQVCGRFLAEATQTCVVTLKHSTELVEGTVHVLFVPDNRNNTGEEIIFFDGDDKPEPLIGDKIDVGEVIAEQFGLELNPYPRSPGAELEDLASSAGRGEVEPTESPFAVLRVRGPKPHAE